MKKFLLILVLGVGMWLAWWLVSPLFIHTVVQEDIDADIQAAIDAALDKTYEDNTIEVTASLEGQLPASVIPEFMDEIKKMEDAFIDEPSFSGMDDMAKAEDTELSGTDSVLDTPVLLKSGAFVSVAHEGTGDVFVVDLGGEQGKILRIENLDILNGPDLRVLISANNTVNNNNELGEYIDLGALRGNKGNQNYAIPKDLDLSSIQSIVIYCKPFHVVFNSASLN